jgi:hypothetical protein
MQQMQPFFKGAGGLALVPPDTIPGLVIWLNPTNGPDSSVDNGSVTYWTNSMNSVLFTPLIFRQFGGAPNLPMTYKSTAASGNQACLYVKNSDFRGTGGSGASEPATNWAQPYWIFSVTRATNSGASNGDFREVSFSGNSGGGVMVTNGFFYAATGVSTPINSGYNYTNRWALISICMSNTTSYIFTNGVLAASGNAGAGTMGNPFYLNSIASQYIFRGFLADLLVYARSLTPSEVDSISTWLMTKYALPDTSSHPEQTFITTNPTGTPRNNFTGGVGSHFTPVQDLWVTQVARWVVAAGGSHTITFHHATLGNVISQSINTATGTPGTYEYVALASPVRINPNPFIWDVNSAEVNLGDSWYDTQGFTFTSDVGSISSSINNGSAGAANTSYVPPNFKYFVP